MKKTLFAFALVTFLVGSSKLAAQVELNPTFGANISALDTKIQDIDAEARVGWNAGVDFIFGGEKTFFFEPGLHYYSFTADLIKDPTNQDEFSLKDKTTIQSLRVPLNIGLNLSGKDALLPIHVKAGVVPSYIVGVKEKSEIGFEREALNDFALAGNLGVGVDIWFLTIKANYEIGLTDFFKESDGKNNMLTLGLGFKFEL